jgi:hypothetical protein
MGIALEFDLSTALSVQLVRLMSKLDQKPGSHYVLLSSIEHLSE